MTKFEYKTVEIEQTGNMFQKNIDSKVLEQTMNQLGQQGWELSNTLYKHSGGTTTQILLIFKKTV